MCGPFLAFAAASDDPPDQGRRGSSLLAYHGGRLGAYVVLGAAAGALGAGVERLGALAGVARAAAIVSGMLMIGWGVSTLLALRGRRAPRLHPPGALQRALGAVVRRIGARRGIERAGITGLATALLPCGWLYAFVAAAGGTGSPIRGVIVMSLFWTGTLPVMMTIGVGLQRVAGPLRRHLPLVTASVVVAIGLLTVAGRLRPVTSHQPLAAAATHVDHR